MNLEDTIAGYIPSPASIELVKQSDLLLIAGVVCAGKDTVVRELLEVGSFRKIISHTTRAPRENHGILEQDGAEYHFISTKQAVDLLLERAFIEAKYVHGNVYGTSVAAVQAAARDGVTAITDIDIQGVHEYLLIKPETKAVFLLPPSVDTWLSRLVKRYGAFDADSEEIKTRFKTAYTEISTILKDERFVVIVNDDLATTVGQIKKLKKGDTENSSDYAREVADHLLDYLSHYR